jgi:hypothetical protein
MAKNEITIKKTFGKRKVGKAKKSICKRDRKTKTYKGQG